MKIASYSVSGTEGSSMRLVKYLSFAIILSGVIAATVFAARIKDITNLAGVRTNQLVGYGLVVGLDGTGDKTTQAPFTDQTFQNMLVQFGIRVPVGRAAQLKNIAAVAVNASLPPFARIGQRLDITISSLGNATSLRGGSLLMTPLRGADGRVYAMAQGSVVVSGFGAQGSDGSKVIVNSANTGSIPNGASVESVIDTPFVNSKGEVIYELIQPDFTTAERIELAINHEFGYSLAKALNAREVLVKVGKAAAVEHPGGGAAFGGAGGYKDEFSSMPREEAFPAEGDNDNSKYVPLISRIENIQLDPADVGARVIANSRTGTIVIGSNVTLKPVAVSHGNLTVIVTERPFVSQANAFAQKGKTVVGKASDINVTQQAGRAFLFAPGPTLNELVEAINMVGAAPGDLIAILEAIKASGSLNADLEII